MVWNRNKTSRSGGASWRRILAAMLAAFLIAGSLPEPAYAAMISRDGRFTVAADGDAAGTEDEKPSLRAVDGIYTYETDEIVLSVNVSGIAVPVGQDAGDYADPDLDGGGSFFVPEGGKVEMRVGFYDQESDEYYAVAAAAGEQYDQVYGVVGVKYSFWMDGVELDMSGCEMSVKAAYKPSVIDMAMELSTAGIGPEVAAEDVGTTVSVSAYALPDGALQDAVLMDCASVSDDGTVATDLSFGMTVSEDGSDAGIMMMDDVIETDPDTGSEPDNDRDVSGSDKKDDWSGKGDAWIVVNEMGTWLVIGSGANPVYTVEYFSWLPVVDKSTDVPLVEGSANELENGDFRLNIIDTSNGGSGNGGVLPTNGDTSKPNGNSLMGLTLQKDESGLASVKTVPKFMRIYDNEVWRYQNAPQAVYIDKVSTNQNRTTNYQLVEIWVLKSFDTDGMTDDEVEAAANERSREGLSDDGDFEEDVLKSYWDIYRKKDMHQFAEHTELKARLVNDLKQVRFTSDPDNECVGNSPDDENDFSFEYYVLIQDSSRIRLVYEPLSKVDQSLGGVDDRTMDFAATFYDYDISNGYIYRAGPPDFDNMQPNSIHTNMEALDVEALSDDSNGINADVLKWASAVHQHKGHFYSYTKESGINSSSNYRGGSGVKLAFGNVNTGTGLGKLEWREADAIDGSKGNELNKWNNNGYLGCTFGLVSSLSDDGEIQYASGVNAPKLFNEKMFDGEEVIGKTTYGDYTLHFNRVGDTYTLEAVNGTGVTNLSKFSNPANSQGNYDGTDFDGKGERIPAIWTNNFWPMDSTDSFGTDGHDVKFGGTDTFKIVYDEDKGQYVSGASKHELRYGPITQKGTDYTFPESDDGKYHNSYFGMRLELSFMLTKDYCGPLEYCFFGDDDMWVFLDDRLVCDIGGVHSAVGEYVNLWDYIDREYLQTELKDGESREYKLTFFYTERGASGSTCWMQFTLPSVSQVLDPVLLMEYSGILTVSKEVGEGIETGPDGNYVAANAENPEEYKDEAFTFLLAFTDENEQPLPANDGQYPWLIVKTDVLNRIDWGRGSGGLEDIPDSGGDGDSDTEYPNDVMDEVTDDNIDVDNMGDGDDDLIDPVGLGDSNGSNDDASDPNTGSFIGIDKEDIIQSGFLMAVEYIGWNDDSISGYYTQHCTGIQVELHRGESIIVGNLPRGTMYTIVESVTPGYIPDIGSESYNSTNSGLVKDETKSDVDTGRHIYSSSMENDSHRVLFVNRHASPFEMPKTGGTGVVAYAVTGTVVMSLGIFGLWSRKRRRG